MNKAQITYSVQSHLYQVIKIFNVLFSKKSMYQQHRSVLWDLNFKALAIQLYQQEAQPADTKVSHT